MNILYKKCREVVIVFKWKEFKDYERQREFRAFRHSKIISKKGASMNAFDNNEIIVQIRNYIIVNIKKLFLFICNEFIIKICYKNL